MHILSGKNGNYSLHNDNSGSTVSLSFQTGQKHRSEIRIKAASGEGYAVSKNRNGTVETVQSDIDKFKSIVDTAKGAKDFVDVSDFEDVDIAPAVEETEDGEEANDETGTEDTE